MNCYVHQDVEALAYCRSCGRPLCDACRRNVQGSVYCAEHVPSQPAAAPAVIAAPAGPGSPGLAFVLGLIPGVGAIYNGQYAKGVIHVVIFGTLISIVESGAAGAFEALFGMLIAVWVFYMAFEAYHTASRRQRGEPVDEFSSLFPAGATRGGPLMGPVLLILLGVLFLVLTTFPQWTRVIFKMWPVLFIGIGVYLLLARLRVRKEVSNERQ